MSAVTMSSADFERHEQRHERREKRFIWIIGILIFLLVLTNALWIWYESQFEAVESWEQEVIQDTGEGNNQFVGRDYYGEAEN
jgi:small-conductance mechanosensitive channel